MNIRIWIIVFVTLFLLILLVVSEFCVLVVYIILVVKRGDTDSVSTSRLFKYQFLEYIPEKSEISTGFVSIYNKIEQDKYVFQERDDDEGVHYTLVSNFGTNEFVCTGSCYCDVSDERRVADAIRISLPYLLVAVTSLIAYSLAQNYFTEECEKRLLGECGSDSSERIVSEVDDCTPALSASLDTVQDETKETSIDEYVDDKPVVDEKYWCRGKCKMRESTFEESWAVGKFHRQENYDAAKKKCESIELDSQMIIKSNQDPILIFQEEVLEPACVEATRIVLVKHAVETLDKENAMKYAQQFQVLDPKIWSPCAAGSGDLLNPSISCRKIVEH